MDIIQGPMPSLSSIPNGQMDEEAMVEDLQPPQEREAFFHPASIHKTPEKGSDWPGLSHVPTPTQHLGGGYCDWSLLGHMLTPLSARRSLIGSPNRTTEWGRSKQGGNRLLTEG